MKRFNSVFAFLLVLLISPLLSSCGSGGLSLSDLTNTGNTNVDGRFTDCKEGKAKPIVLPPVVDPENFSFVVVTDMHMRTDRDDYMDQIGNFSTNKSASFVLNCGDLVDDGESKNYNYVLQREGEALDVPLYSALGNHDLYSDGWDDFRSKIGPSSASFTYGNSFFLIIDTASCKVGGKQFDWIEDKLRESHAEHKFVISHMCLYDSDVETPTILCDPDERLKMISLLKEYDVDYFLCGHKHWVEEDKYEGTEHIMAGTASPWKRPYNSAPLLWYFQVNGGDIHYTKVHFQD